jgi:hypothetical protein
MQLLGFKTGFCHFCRYETDTEPYDIGESILDASEPDGLSKTEHGFYERENIWLCDFCAMLSRNDMKNKDFRVLNWGLNHILKKLGE